MSKKELLTKEQKKELQSYIDEVIGEAKEVVDNYKETPSKESGSFIHVHENSPYLATREERLITFNGKKMKIKPDKA